MKNNAENVYCNDLIHVVCLPFNISCQDDSQPRSMNDIGAMLAKSTTWTEGGALDAAGEEGWDKYRRYQTRAYFHPFVRRFLYDRSRVRRYRRNDIHHIKVDLGHSTTGDFTLNLEVLRCELILFQPDIGLLLLEVSPRETLDLRRTQLLLDTFRRLYPPYVDTFEVKDKKVVWTGGHCPATVTLLDLHGKDIGTPGIFRDHSGGFMEAYAKELLRDIQGEGREGRPRYPLAAHWRTLLDPFVCGNTDVGGFRVQHLGDDRAPILNWIALEDPQAVDPGNWIRLCFADAPGKDPYSYACGFVADFDEKYCYDRYWYVNGESSDSPSRILNCGYAFSFVGSSKDDSFFANDRNGAHASFRHIYVEMGLIAHFQKAALLAASQRLSEMVTRGNAGRIKLPDQRKVRDFYDHFVEFTQNFWFDEISPQEQGRELFKMWREHLRIQELYEEVRQELKDLVDYTELRATGELNDKLSFIAKAGFVLALLSLLAGVFGMNPLPMNELSVSGLVLTIGFAIATPLIAWRRGHFKRTPS